MVLLVWARPSSAEPFTSLPVSIRLHDLSPHHGLPPVLFCVRTAEFICYDAFLFLSRYMRFLSTYPWDVYSREFVNTQVKENQNMTRETLSKWFLYADLWSKDARSSCARLLLRPLRDWQTPPPTDWCKNPPIRFHFIVVIFWFPPGLTDSSDRSGVFSVWMVRSVKSIRAVCVCVCFIRLSDAALCLVKLYWLKNRLVCFICVMIRSVCTAQEHTHHSKIRKENEACFLLKLISAVA